MKDFGLLLSQIKSRCGKRKCYENVACHLSEDELRILWERDRAEYMHKPSIDRKDVLGDYSFDNCRFIEQSENASKRASRGSYLINPELLLIDVSLMIKQLKDVGVTQREIAKHTGANPMTVVQWKKKTYRPSGLYLEKLYELYSQKIGDKDESPDVSRVEERSVVSQDETSDSSASESSSVTD